LLIAQVHSSGLKPWFIRPLASIQKFHRDGEKSEGKKGKEAFPFLYLCKKSIEYLVVFERTLAMSQGFEPLADEWVHAKCEFNKLNKQSKQT
jgi:hypothetical protein